MNTQKLRWGIVSTGTIARTLAEALGKAEDAELVAVGSRKVESGRAFAERFGVPHAHTGYAALFADPEVDIVYIATPHSTHAALSMQAARAGKHVLCEKPLAMNYAEAESVLEAAREHDVFLMEAFMYRCHPQTRKLVELVQSGVIGQVSAIQASFGFDGEFPAHSRLVKNELGGGGIMDVGCYPVSMARLLAGAAIGEPFSEPLEVRALGHVSERSRVDEQAVAILKFPGEILATLATSVQLWQENVVRVLGRKGRLLVREPWLPARAGGESEIVIERPGQADEIVRVTADHGLYAYEIAAVTAQIGARETREMSHLDSLGNARVLDQWRHAIGLTYESDSALRTAQRSDSGAR